MYLTYDTNQATFGRRKSISWRDIGLFRPTHLVRVSDMAKVDGTEAAFGYCALSYSWNWSGEITDHGNGNSTCDDEGLHEIIKHNWNPERPDHDEKTIDLVHFSGVVQEICLNFGIDYIWYDKKCIDQQDKKSKEAAINQMHKIYKNALFTVVLIPELNPTASTLSPNIRFQDDPYDGYCFQQILGSKWCERMWTLEEAVLSRNMVFVGQTAHFWSHQMIELFFYGKKKDHHQLHQLLEKLCTVRKEACQILHFAHRRQSSKDHDKVFALANVFADTIEVKSDYGLELQDVLRTFYSSLAKEDITILYFGKPFVGYPSTMQKYTFLPSWTGIAGVHVLEISLSDLQGLKPAYSILNQRHIHITCDYISIKPEALLAGNHNEILDLQSSFNIKMTHYITATANEFNVNVSAVFHPVAFLSLTESSIQQECQVLDIPFNAFRRHGIFHPVIMKDKVKDTYKSIGVFIIHLRGTPAKIRVPLDNFSTVGINGVFDIE